jgi:hypothetical protein
MTNNPMNARNVCASMTFALMLLFPSLQAASEEARITQIVREVNLLASQAKSKPAVLNDKVSDGTGVRTGDQSRSELTFSDLTIERLGSNTIFSFNRSGRSVRLNSGSMLLRVPKDSGGASMSTSAVTVGITGTTVILEKTLSGRNKLVVLEGSARLSLKKNPKESVYVRGGQMEDVPPGASQLPPPVNVDVSEIMKNHPLITDFPPLPSENLITATASNPPSPPGQQPSNPGSNPPGPVFVPPIVPPAGGGPVGPAVVGPVAIANPPNPNRKIHVKNPRNPNPKKKNPGGNAPPVGNIGANANGVNANNAGKGGNAPAGGGAKPPRGKQPQPRKKVPKKQPGNI